MPQNTFETRLDTFGNNFGHFWNFEKKYFENFRKLDPPWNTGHKIFQKNFPKTCSKHVWILLGTLLGIFGILKIFFFENFRKLDPPRNTGQKNFSKNLPQNTFKTRLDAFGNDFGHFWNFEKKKLKFFEKSTLHGTPGIIFFFEKITLKHVWIVLGTILGIFEF